MSAQREPTIFEFQAEARNLEYLLRHHLDDRSFVAQDRPGQLLYFVDAHELQSYIAPNERLTGFMLLAEQAHLARGPGDQFELEISLKNEQLLHELLFDRGRQTGLLPSHEREIEDEIAYRKHKSFLERISVLDQARVQAQRVLLLAQRTLTPREVRVAERSPERRRRLVNFFRQVAPALMALLRPNPVSPKLRIDALEADSNVVYLDELDWSAFGYDQAACQRLNALQRPSDEKIEDWRRYLEGRRKNSYNSNHVDAEAIAYLQELNAELAQHGPRVRALLVTRAMTLISAVQRRGGADFLRHPRLLLLQRPADHRHQDPAMSGKQSEEALIVALKTYDSQLEAQHVAPAQQSEGELNDAVDTLVNIWSEFERARLTIELRSQTEAEPSITDDVAVDAEFHKLLGWLRDDDEVEQLIADELQKAIHQFGRETFALGQGRNTDPVRARIIPLREPTRSRVVPMVAGAPGPIEFLAPGLRCIESHILDVTDMLTELEGNPAERYVAWATLLACQGRWKLAATYANGAIEVSRLNLLPRREADWSKHEAQLLRAQISRLTPPGPDEAQHVQGAWARYQANENALARSTRPDDPRIPLERATQMLEYRWLAEAEPSNSASLASGFEFLRSGLAMAQHDKLLQTRILAIGIAYFLAACVRPELWPELGSADRNMIGQWHQQLHALLTEQRKTLYRDEISIRARAMELIGFQRLAAGDSLSLQFIQAGPEPLRIPRELHLDVFDVCRRIEQSKDGVANLIAKELEQYVRRLDRYRQRDLIYAPLWTPKEYKRVVELIEDQETRELVRSTYDGLHQVAGASQKLGVQPHDRDTLNRLVEEFSKARESLLTSERARHISFYPWMEACYARLLLTRIAWQDQRKRELQALATEYRQMVERFPDASIPRFRLDIVLSDLGENEEEAFSQAQQALDLVEKDPYLQAPQHWVKSTMKRRVAARFMKRAEKLREALEEQAEKVEQALEERADEMGEAPEERVAKVTKALESDPSYAQLRHDYLDHLRWAFSIVYEGYPDETKSRDDDFYELEAGRRINNIVYYASLILEQDPESAYLKNLGLGKDELAAMARSLHPARIQDVTDDNIAHTIGYAYAVLGEAGQASAAAKQLMLLFGETGVDPKNKSVAKAIADALRWLSRDADENVATGSAPSREMAVA